MRQVDAGNEHPGYFLLQRPEPPSLNLSGWLEPAARYQGLDEFWASELMSPTYAGRALVRVEKLRVGPWEVMAYDMDVPPELGVEATQANLRAELVLAGTWVDLHLSAVSGESPAKLRAQLLEVLEGIAVVEK